MTDFFYPTVCYICKKYTNDKFVQCDQCELISYCSREHQIEHRPKHEDLCNAIKYVRETYKEEVSVCESSIRMDFLKEMVRGELERPLKLYEVQMFIWPKEMCLALLYKK